jgi:hypothetical protein
MAAIIVMLSMILTTVACSAAGESGISVKVNGKTIRFDQPPIMQNDRVLIPLRGVLEAMGVTVFLDGDVHCVTKETYVYLTDRDIFEAFSEHEFKFFVDNEEVFLDQPPIIYNDRTMVPVRAVSEAFGAFVDWDGATQTVIIEGSIPTEERLTEEEIAAADAFTEEDALAIARDNFYTNDFVAIYADYTGGYKTISLLYYEDAYDEEYDYWGQELRVLKVYDSGWLTDIPFYGTGEYDADYYADYAPTSLAEYLPFDDDDYSLGAVAFIGDQDSVYIPEPIDEFLDRYFGDVEDDFWDYNAFEMVDADGMEMYAIIPKYVGTRITVDAIYYDDDGYSYYEKRLYEGEEPIYLFCNPSELRPNTDVTFEYEGEILTFRPRINLMDYQVETVPGVLDITLYG